MNIHDVIGIGKDRSKTFFHSQEGRQAIFLGSITRGPVLESTSTQLDALFNAANRLAAGDTTPPAEYGYTVTPNTYLVTFGDGTSKCISASTLSAAQALTAHMPIVASVVLDRIGGYEPPTMQVAISDPAHAYIAYTITAKSKQGVALDAMIDEINQALADGYITVPTGVSEVIDSAGMSGIPLPIADYFRFGTDKATFFLTRNGLPLTDLLHKRYDTALFTDKLMTKFKRDRREDSSHTLQLRSRVLSRSTNGTFRVEAQGFAEDIPVELIEIEVFEAWSYGRAILTLGSYRTTVGVLKPIASTWLSRCLHGTFDGNSPIDVNRFNRMLGVLGIGADVYAPAGHLDGTQFTAKDRSGHFKGLATMAHLGQDMLMLFLDAKAHAFRNDDELWMSFNPLHPSRGLNSDRESVQLGTGDTGSLDALHRAIGLLGLFCSIQA